MLWMSGDLLDRGYEEKILLIEDNLIKGVVEGINWKEKINPRSRYLQKYGFNDLKDSLRVYIEKNGPLPKEGLLFSEKAKRFL